MTDLVAYSGLFGIAFLAATILPAQSEVAVAGMVASQRFSPWLVVAVASGGNVLGSVTNWVIGRLVTRFEGRRWFPVRRVRLARAERWYRRWGVWSLLLSWLPIVGDPLTIVAGFLREPLPRFLALVTLAKVARYVAVAAFASAWTEPTP